MNYDNVRVNAEVVLEINSDGLTEETVAKYRAMIQESYGLTDEQTRYVKLMLLNRIVSSENDTTETSLTSVHAVFNDFELNLYLSLAKLLRKTRDGIAATEDEKIFLTDTTWDNTYVALAACAILLRNLCFERTINITKMKETIKKLDSLILEAENLSKELGREDFYVDSY